MSPTGNDGIHNTVSTRSASFFSSTVKPTVDEFLGDVLDIRRGRLAAIVLYHMADYWLLDGATYDTRQEYTEALTSLHDSLKNECEEFSIIRDIADATKHASLFVPKDKNRPRKLSSAEQVTRPAGMFGAPFGEAVFSEASTVMIKLDAGTSQPLAKAIGSVLTMWEELLFGRRGTA